MTVALIDADIICYKAACVAQMKIDWDGDGDPTEVLNVKQAKEVSRHLVDSWTKAAECNSAILVFSDRTVPKMSFRYRIYPNYKAHRPDEKPALHNVVINHLTDVYNSVIIPGLEGDDTMGILATHPDGGCYVIVSIDKDMKTLACRQVNPDDTNPQVQKLTPFTADYHWMFQTLTGDPVDNFKGCPQIGPKKAQQILAMSRSLGEMWERVCCTYGAAYANLKTRPKFNGEMPEKLALMNARCARILRHGDYEKGLVRLWTPDDDDEWMPAVEGTVRETPEFPLMVRKLGASRELVKLW